MCSGNKGAVGFCAVHLHKVALQKVQGYRATWVMCYGLSVVAKRATFCLCTVPLRKLALLQVWWCYVCSPHCTSCTHVRYVCYVCYVRLPHCFSSTHVCYVCYVCYCMQHVCYVCYRMHACVLCVFATQYQQHACGGFSKSQLKASPHGAWKKRGRAH